MENGTAIFKGCWPAIVTPFSADGSAVDYRSLESLIESLIKNNVDGIVICGSTGEAMTLTDTEYFEVISRALAIVGGRIPCAAGIGTSSTARAVELASKLSKEKLSALMVVTPPYNKPTPAGLVAHFQAIARVTSLPIIAYNVPGRTGLNMLPATVAMLAEKRLIAALKDASGSIDQLLDTLALVGDSISVMSGEDSLTHPAMACGARGIISVVGNAFPGEMAALTRAALAGDWDRSRELHLKLLPAMRAMFMETNPIPVKAAVALKGVIQSGIPRLPLMAAQPATIERLKTVLSL